MQCRFGDPGGRPVLKDLFDFPRDVYPVGRLDADSEGLLLLTNDKRINSLLLTPKNQHRRTYLVQVEGIITDDSLKSLRTGVIIKLKNIFYKTMPAEVKLIPEPDYLPERIPPVRFRKNIPTSWLELTIKEGKNRQVRKMTASVGFPTVRLVRTAIASLRLNSYSPGFIMELNETEIYRLLRLKF